MNLSNTKNKPIETSHYYMAVPPMAPYAQDLIAKDIQREAAKVGIKIVSYTLAGNPFAPVIGFEMTSSSMSFHAFLDKWMDM